MRKEEGIDLVQTGIAVFAYNRSWHLQQVLGGLRQNDLEWCNTVVTIQKLNKGQAQSIVTGVGKVLEESATW